jgi:UDP:flavonoid glycosyltransferase YjiC (YdhE family)
MLEIRAALVERGADVVLATHGGPFRPVLDAAGAPHDLIGDGLTAARAEEFVRSVPGVGPPDQSMWSDAELLAWTAAEVDYFRHHGVSAVVTGWTLPALLSTRVAGVPLVTEHAGSWVPPVFERGLLPAPLTPVGIPFQRWLPRPLVRRMFNAGVANLSIYTDGFNRAAAELGVPGVPSFPALLLGDLTLLTDVPALLGLSAAEVDAWRPSDRYRPETRIRYAGPIYARLPQPLPERVERFLAAPGPIVYVAITSTGPEVVRAALDAAERAGARVVVAGTTHELADLAGARSLVEPVLPSHLVMPHVDAAVITGGQGSVQTALASGTPFVGIPLQPEQHLNVHLAERAGAARLVPRDEVDSATLAAAIAEVLGSTGHREAARRLQAAMAEVDGPGAAADAILELVAA